MAAYYNEHDLFAAQWLRNLIAAGHIAPGEVDTRSIEDVTPDDLSGFQQCHFFAGIGIWSRALRDAGWPDDRVVWTGSCPCQPFSAAGKGAGFDDERHLWPAWHHLIQERRPPVVLGEQVASALAWLDLVSADMEAAGYAFGASDLCAAGFGGAHIRQRLYFVGVGDAVPAGRPEGRTEPGGESSAGAGAAGRMGDADVRHPAEHTLLRVGQKDTTEAAGRSPDSRLAFSDGGDSGPERQQRSRDAAAKRPGPLNGLWRDADWLCCTDGKWRPVEPGTFPLADAAPQRVGRLRAYGNGLDLETATSFVGAVMDALGRS